jgi:hypothetical protein
MLAQPEVHPHFSFTPLLCLSQLTKLAQVHRALSGFPSIVRELYEQQVSLAAKTAEERLRQCRTATAAKTGLQQELAYLRRNVITGYDSNADLAAIMRVQQAGELIHKELTLAETTAVRGLLEMAWSIKL